jgi:hypothetical protein
MRISQIFAQGGGNGHGCDRGHGCGFDCCDRNCDCAFRHTGYFYRSYGDYYCYNDGCGFRGNSGGGLLGIFG